MIFNVSAVINFAKDYQISIDSDFDFTDEEIEVYISPSFEGLNVVFKIEIANQQQAFALAENKLLKIVNLLSWLHNIPILKSKITGCSYQETKNSQSSIVIAETISLKDHISIKKGLGKEAIMQLSKDLSKVYSPDTEEILLMWKDAISEDSKGLKFFLLYRLLEKIFHKRTAVDKWIMSEYPTTQKAKGQYGEDITIFTFLRDNIHAKSVDFPFHKIEENLSQLQNITQKAIQDKYYI